MKADVTGSIRNTKLSERHAFLPLFEAIINSIDAIGERDEGSGRIEVIISRLGTFELGSPLSEPIHQIEIVDDGIGFTSANFASFDTMNSQHKSTRGGRGVGRIMWLKAFESVKIESAYSEAGQWRERSFQFAPTIEGIADHVDREVTAKMPPVEPRTSVKLVGFKDPYRRHIAAEPLAIRIVEHCLEYFLLGTVPSMIVSDRDTGDRVHLQSVYREQTLGDPPPRSLIVGQHELTIRDVLIRRATDRSRHLVHFCANKRVVDSVPLHNRIPHLQGPLKEEGGDAFYHAYVSGSALDAIVDAERQSFSYGDEEEDGSDSLRKGPLERAAINSAAEFLEPRTAHLRARALTRVRAFIEEAEPRYRPLLTHRKDVIERMSTGLNDVDLDLKLHSEYQDWKQQIRRDAAQRLQQEVPLGDEFAEFEKLYHKSLGEMSELANAELADYVKHRATVLQFFEKLLGADDTGKFRREHAVHSFLFPQRTESDQVDYESHNLWMLDERLAYHRYLSSDLPFDRQRSSPVEVDSKRRPDLLIFNRRFAFTPSAEPPFPSVIIFEFKRPERTEYPPEDGDPIDQVLNYVAEIKEGRARRGDKSTINVPANTAFYCYIVATLTPNIRRFARNAGLVTSPDGDGFFGYNPVGAYFEIMSHEKVLSDARKRSKAFFDKLGIPVRQQSR